MARDNGSVVGAALLGVVVGGAIGAIAGILFAPASGDETRRRIRETSTDLRDSAVDMMDDGRERVEEFVDESRDRIADLVQDGRRELTDLTASLRSLIHEGKQAYRERRDELVAEVDEDDEGDSEVAPAAAPTADEPATT